MSAINVAKPTILPAKRLPAIPLVAPTDNIRVFPRWSPRAILLAPKQSNIHKTHGAPKELLSD